MKKNKYVQEISHYEILVPRDYIYHLQNLISTNRHIKSEAIGYLVGRAKAVWVDKLCAVCHKPVLEKKKHKPTEKELTDIYFNKDLLVHQSCYESKSK